LRRLIEISHQDYSAAYTRIVAAYFLIKILSYRLLTQTSTINERKIFLTHFCEVMNYITSQNNTFVKFLCFPVYYSLFLKKSSKITSNILNNK